MSSTFVQIRDIHFSYARSTPILKAVSFAMARGECVGLTGPSGCGKSTLAQIVAGHLAPQSGQVLLDGQDVTGRPQRQIFLVSQDSDLFPWQRVSQQIEFALPKPNEAEVRKLMELTQLSDFHQHFPHQLSGGMKKRLSIARALAVDPKLVIFDESFISLDFNLRLEIFADLKRIWQNSNTSVLMISHDPRDLKEITQREVRLELVQSK